MTEMNDERFCPMCENHCPEDEVRCGRGRRYFAGESGGDMHEHHEGRHTHRDEEFRRHPEGMRRHGPMHDPEGMHRHGPMHDPDSLEGMFMRTARHLRHSGRKQFGSTQDRIIRILDENGGTMGQKALQELLHVRPGSISEILTKMEEKGLITRTKDSDDRRASLITLTADAETPEEPESFFSVLTEEEKETLTEILAKLLEQEHE